MQPYKGYSSRALRCEAVASLSTLLRSCYLPIQIRQDNLSEHVFVLLLRYLDGPEKLPEMIAGSEQSSCVLMQRTEDNLVPYDLTVTNV
jgi:hypothetical protein